MSDRRYYVTQTRLAAIGWQTVLIENAVKGEPPDRDTAAWALRTIRDVLMALVVEAAKRIDTPRAPRRAARRGSGAEGGRDNGPRAQGPGLREGLGLRRAV